MKNFISVIFLYQIIYVIPTSSPANSSFPPLPLSPSPAPAPHSPPPLPLLPYPASLSTRPYNTS